MLRTEQTFSGVPELMQINVAITVNRERVREMVGGIVAGVILEESVLLATQSDQDGDDNPSTQLQPGAESLLRKLRYSGIRTVHTPILFLFLPS